MKHEGIKYKDTRAMPGSDLFNLLSDARDEKDQKKAQELRKKAEQCYTDCEARHRKSIGG
jgi:hypothetical protein